MAAPLVAAVLPPPPVLARPIPPSGAATVSVLAVAPKEEQEDEEAVENARASMAAYRPEEEHHLPALSLLALIVDRRGRRHRHPPTGPRPAGTGICAGARGSPRAMVMSAPRRRAEVPAWGTARGCERPDLNELVTYPPRAVPTLGMRADRI